MILHVFRRAEGSDRRAKSIDVNWFYSCFLFFSIFENFSTKKWKSQKPWFWAPFHDEIQRISLCFLVFSVFDGKKTNFRKCMKNVVVWWQNMHSYPGKNAFWVFFIYTSTLDKSFFAIATRRKNHYKTNGFWHFRVSRVDFGHTVQNCVFDSLTWGLQA